MSECTTCTYYGRHLSGPSESLPWPCAECAGGEKYIERGKRKRAAPIRVQNEALRARVARLEEALRFILDECDWEEGCGDNRIGPAIRRALEEK